MMKLMRRYESVRCLLSRTLKVRTQTFVYHNMNILSPCSTAKALPVTRRKHVSRFPHCTTQKRTETYRNVQKRTETYTHTQTHTDTHTHRHTIRCDDRPPLLEEPFAQTLSGKTLGFYIQMSLHTDVFTHGRFLHTNTFTHIRFYTQTLVHTEAFTHKRFYTQTLSHTHTQMLAERVAHTKTYIVLAERIAWHEKQRRQPHILLAKKGLTQAWTHKK